MMLWFQSAPRERGESLNQFAGSLLEDVSIRAPRAGRKGVSDFEHDSDP